MQNLTEITLRKYIQSKFKKQKYLEFFSHSQVAFDDKLRSRREYIPLLLNVSNPYDGETIVWDILSIQEGFTSKIWETKKQKSRRFIVTYKSSNLIWIEQKRKLIRGRMRKKEQTEYPNTLNCPLKILLVSVFGWFMDGK